MPIEPFKASNIAVKALPSVAGTRRKRRAPYLKRYVSKVSPARSRVRGNERGLVPKLPCNYTA